MNDSSDGCAGVEAILLEYFEDTLDATDRARVEQHAAQCLPCGSLIRDVNGIRDDASVMADFSPPRDLWAGIETRIQPRVVSIETVRPAGRASRRWLAAAAVLLVATTSTVTYLATSRSAGGRAGGGDSQPVAATNGVTPTENATVAGAPVESPIAGESDAGRSLVAQPAGTLASASAAGAPGATELPYDGEIRRLQSALVERRTQLDTATVRIVEENLRLIDTAVRQARAALASDPASGFLTEQFNNVLEKKVELLRTAALLPSRS